jgi:hypothetical protein
MIFADGNWNRHNRWRRDGRYGQQQYGWIPEILGVVAGEAASGQPSTGIQHYTRPIIIGVSVGVGTWALTGLIKHILLGKGAAK